MTSGRPPPPVRHKDIPTGARSTREPESTESHVDQLIDKVFGQTATATAAFIVGLIVLLGGLQEMSPELIALFVGLVLTYFVARSLKCRRWLAIPLLVLAIASPFAVAAIRDALPAVEEFGRRVTESVRAFARARNAKDPLEGAPTIPIDENAVMQVTAGGFTYVAYDRAKTSEIRGYSLTSPDVERVFRLPGSPIDMTICAGALLVSYRRLGRGDDTGGNVTRVSLEDAGHRAPDGYPYTDGEPGELECQEEKDIVWATKPNRPVAVPINALDLDRPPKQIRRRSADEFTSIEMDGHFLWATDRPKDLVYRIDTESDADETATFSTTDEPSGLAVVNDVAHVVHASKECLRRIDGERDGNPSERVERGDGVGFESPGARVSTQGGVLYMYELGGHRIARVDAKTGVAMGPALDLGPNVRLHDVDVRPNGEILAMDRADDEILRLGAKLQQTAAGRGSPPVPCTIAA